MASGVSQYEILVEWDWPGATYRYSMLGAVVFGGNSYEPRITEISGLGGMYVDRKEADFAGLSVTLCNLADDWSSNFPFHLLDAADDFEDKAIRVYVLNRTAGTRRLFWHGITKRPEFDPENLTCTIAATYPWDAIEIDVPAVPLGHRCPYPFGGSDYETAGGTVPSPGCPYDPGDGIGVGSFTSCPKDRAGCEERGMLSYFGGWTRIAPTLKDDVNNLVDRETIRKGVVPLVYGSGEIKIRPEIYRAVISGQELIVNGIISGVHPDLPFDEAQLEASNLKLADVARASWAKFWTGVSGQAIPGNKTIFPEGVGRSLVAYFAARFSLTKEQIDRFSDEVAYHEVTARIDGGRKILRSSGQTENPVYVLEDVLRDRVYGIGLPSSQIDNSAVTSAASFVGSRFRGRYEIDKPEHLLDWVQRMLATFGGYLTWNDGLMQIGAKRDTETAVAIFGTGGYPIENYGAVSCHEDGFDELANELSVRYRSKLRNKREFAYYDKGAQIRAGNGLVKKVEAELFLEGIYDDEEAAIAAAVWLREEQNLNLTISFSVTLADWDASGVRCGQVVRVNSVHVWNNASNYLFRVLGFEIDPQTFSVTVQGRVYKQAVYAYNADPIDGDILRDGGDTSTAARPPDVENVSAEAGDIYPSPGNPANADDDTRMVRIACSWDYPDVSADHATDNEEGIYPEYPIEAVALWWRYADESIHDLKYGARVQYPTAAADIQAPFHKKREIEVWFVAIGRNNGQGALGYVIDPTQTTFLNEDLDATSPTFDVGDASEISAAEYLRCEGEIMKVASVGGDTVTVEASGGDRAPQFDTEAVDHPEGTEIGVAVKSHPTDTVDLSTPRYTLPVPEDVRSRRRPKHLRARCDDVDHDAGEKYLWYVTYGTALDDGSDFMDAWGTEDLDPLAPEAFDPTIKLFKSQQHFVLIDFEDLDALYGSDASGIAPKIRCAAKLKKNFSSSPSALANQAGHGNAPNGPPSTPTAAEIAFEDVPGSNKIRCLFTIGSSENTRPLDGAGDPTFSAQNIDIVGPVLQKWDKAGAAWSSHFERPTEEIEDPETQKTQVVSIELHRGSKWRWVRSFAKNRGTRRKKSPDANVVFIVGQKTDDITTITDLAIAAFGATEATNSIEQDPRHSDLLITFTQPADPVALHLLQIQKKKDAAVKWNRVPPVDILHDDDDEGNPIDTTGVKKLRVTVQHPKNEPMDYRVRLVSSDGSKTAWATRDATSGDESGAGDLAIRSDANGPSSTTISHVVRNHIIGNPSNATVDFVYTPYMDGAVGDNLFGAPDSGFGPVREITLVIQPRNAANSADVGRPKRVTVAADQDKGSLAAPFELAFTGLDPGRRYRIKQLRYANGAGEVVRANDVDFVAGAGSYDYDATSISVGTIAFTQDDNRNSNTTVSITQPSTPVLLETATYEVSYDNGSTWKHRKARHLLGKATKYSVAGAVVILDSIQHRKNISQMKVRVILTPFGATYETGDTIAAPNKAITSNAASVADDGYATDIVPGTAAAAPTFKRATIGNGGLFAAFTRPADARPTLQGYEFQFADSSSATVSVARDWLDADTGSAAYTSVAPNVDANNAAAVNLANATFFSPSNRFTTADLRKRDLATTFKSNVSTGNGALTLFVRARIVDVDNAGTLRYGNWSAFSAVTFKSTEDKDHDEPARSGFTGRVNLIEGFGCFGAASAYPNPVTGAGVDTLGKEFRYGPGAAAQLIATAASLGQSGAPSNSSNKNIYWDKATRSISVYGNVGTAGNKIVTPLYGTTTLGMVLWFTFAIRTSSGFTIPDFVVDLYDTTVGSAVAAQTVSGLALTTNYQIVAVRLEVALVSTNGDVSLRFTFANWTTPTNPVFVTHGCLSVGNELRLWEPGAQESKVNYATGVSRSNFGSLAALEASGGRGNDGIATWGVLNLT